MSRLIGRSSIGFSLEVNEDLALRRARVVPIYNTGYNRPSFINYNLTVYSLTNFFTYEINHGNDNITGKRALLANQTLSSFADAQVDEIFKKTYTKHIATNQRRTLEED